MISNERNLKEYQERLGLKFKEKIEELKGQHKESILKIRQLEKENENYLHEMEKEINQIKLKYSSKTQEILNIRNKEIDTLNKIKEDINFWFKVLVNNKNTNNLINERDYPVLKNLININYEYIDRDINKIKLIFEFSENEFFNNKILEKQYNLSNDGLIETIISSNIEWKKDKDYTKNIIQKKIKNKQTGELITKEINDPLPSFFNFFFNYTFPDNKKIKEISISKEKNLGEFLDKEYEILSIFKNEIIPYASEYYVGIIQDFQDFDAYLDKNIDNFD
jgi:nucleosome assembly protein 1-like 1